MKGDEVKLIHGMHGKLEKYDRVYITSLYTFSWKAVHQIIEFYLRKQYKAEITIGGVYATLCPRHIYSEFGDRVQIFRGYRPELDEVMPAYNLIPKYRKSLIHTSRGCPRRCDFCQVKLLEPRFTYMDSIKHLTHKDHHWIAVYDNNFLYNPNWRNIMEELRESERRIDFIQGLDSRLVTEEVVWYYRRLHTDTLRLAYDKLADREWVLGAIDLFTKAGLNPRKIMAYTLYNWTDTPEDYLQRLKDLLLKGVHAYPMCYEPPKPQPLGMWVGKHWTREQVKTVKTARRLWARNGTFVPYKKFLDQLLPAKTLEEGLRSPFPTQDSLGL